MKFGGSAISEQLFQAVIQLVPKGGRLLEFGSGEGTKALLKMWRVISVEHNPKYYVNPNTIRADIRAGWYNSGAVRIALAKGPYDLILIDGPPGKARANIQVDLFQDVTCPVIFDDVNREIDRVAMKRFCRQLGYTFEIIKENEKDFSICLKEENHM